MYESCEPIKHKKKTIKIIIHILFFEYEKRKWRDSNVWKYFRFIFVSMRVWFQFKWIWKTKKEKKNVSLVHNVPLISYVNWDYVVIENEREKKRNLKFIFLSFTFCFCNCFRTFSMFAFGKQKKSKLKKKNSSINKSTIGILFKIVITKK